VGMLVWGWDNGSRCRSTSKMSFPSRVFPVKTVKVHMGADNVGLGGDSSSREKVVPLHLKSSSNGDVNIDGLKSPVTPPPATVSAHSLSLSLSLTLSLSLSLIFIHLRSFHDALMKVKGNVIVKVKALTKGNIMVKVKERKKVDVNVIL
jgi:hypothetical protein